MMYKNTDFDAAHGPREKRAKANIHHAANWIIGGYENGMLDHPQGSEEYEQYDTALKDHEGLADEIYYAATTDLYDEGFVGWGGDVPRVLADIKFLGKKKLMEMVENELKKQGY